MAKKNHINKATQQPRDSFCDAKDLVEIRMGKPLMEVQNAGGVG